MRKNKLAESVIIIQWVLMVVAVIVGVSSCFIWLWNSPAMSDSSIDVFSFNFKYFLIYLISAMFITECIIIYTKKILLFTDMSYNYRDKEDAKIDFIIFNIFNILIYSIEAVILTSAVFFHKHILLIGKWGIIIFVFCMIFYFIKCLLFRLFWGDGR